MRTVSAPVLTLLLALAAAVAVPAGRAAEPDPAWRAARLAPLRLETGIVFKTGDGQALTLDLYRPTVTRFARAPLMLFTHGGGWTGGSKDNIILPPHYGTLKRLGENGIACASVDYRRVRRGETTAFLCVADCLDAARFLQANAERLGLDPGRFGVWGDSAGGHLALTVALGDQADFPGDEGLKNVVPVFRCVVAYYPLTSFLRPELHQGGMFAKPDSFKHLLGGPLAERQREAIALSPAEHLRRDSPPVLLLHGDQDQILGIGYSRYLLDLGRERGADVSLLEVKNAKHGFSGENLDPAMAEINRLAAEFIVARLAAPAPAE